MLTRLYIHTAFVDFLGLYSLSNSIAVNLFPGINCLSCIVEQKITSWFKKRAFSHDVGNYSNS